MSKNNTMRDTNKREAKAPTMEVVRVISEHKRVKTGRLNRQVTRPPAGKKRVMAIVRFSDSKQLFTRHIDVLR